MRIEGAFTTRATGDQMRELLGSAERVNEVPALTDVVRIDPRTLAMVYSPRLVMGPVPLSTTIETVSESDERVDLLVTASRGAQAIEVALALRLEAADARSTVSWVADVAVRGNIASVGQRVARDLIARAIDDILTEAAHVAEHDAGTISPS